MRPSILTTVLLSAWLALSVPARAAEPKALSSMQQDVVRYLDDIRPELVAANQEIWNFAELGLEEYRSAARLVRMLKKEGFKVRVISMPCWELFEKQDQAYRDSVLPPSVKARVSVEMATTFGWSRYVGPSGHSIGMHSFGASAPLKDLQKHFGFTVENIVAAAKEQIQSARH